MEATTLKQFWENTSIPEGYYAVWTCGFIRDGEKPLYGFSGAVVEYSNQGGFKDYPDWMDNVDESEINIVLLNELPSINDF